MKLFFTKLLAMVTKLIFYGICIQCMLFNLLMAIDGNAQKVASMYDVSLDVNFENATFEETLSYIQEKTNYVFSYDKGDFSDLNVRFSFKAEGIVLAELLIEISKSALVGFKQINNNIYIKNLKSRRYNKEIEVVLQTVRITGKVISSENNEGLPGVNIMVKGTTDLGTITDLNGNYSIEIPSEGTTLVFSYVGYLNEEIVVDQKSVIDVLLVPDIQSLEEIVVIGYGTQRKVTVTGAVSSIQANDVVQNSSASLANALAGRLSGLTSIQSAGGQPGRDDATLYLRGVATTNGRAPLILIDGVPRDNIRTIDPNEVASISILKDASATAVFGVRGANGVILITTKRGVKGKMELSLNAEQSFSSFTREPERLHSLEYMRLRNEASQNDGIATLPFDQVTMDRYANPLAGLDPNDPDYEEKARIRKYMYPDHDYYREYISRYAPQTRVNINARGGSDRVSYFVNAGYLHQGGNLNTEPESVLGYDPSSKMDRYNFRANLDYNVTKSLQSFLNIGSYIERVNMPAAWLYGNDTNWMMRDLFYQAQTILPITPGPTTIAGFDVAPGQIVDPGYMDRSAFEIMNRFGYRNEVRSNLNTSFGLELDLSEAVTEGLSVKGMVSYDSRATSALQGDKSERLYLAEINPDTDRLSYAVKRSDESLLSLSKASDSRYNINLQGSINYARTLGKKHDLRGMVLAQRDYWETVFGEIPYNLLGISARLIYGYDNRYLSEVNIGYNGSEQFAPGKRFGFFPAVSAGWVISNENFLSDDQVITNLKLRASYGKVGNDKIGNERFLYLDNISLTGGPLGSLGLGRGINQGLLGNPDLTWEVARKQNYGIDAQLLGDLDLSFDYFVENRSKILISRGMVPEFQGVPLGSIPKVNMGKVDNKGYEIELTYNKVLLKDLFVTVRGHYSYNHNIVQFIDEPVRDESYAYRYRSTGYSIEQQWGYKIDYSNGNGYFNSQQELDQYLMEITYGFGPPRIGDLKYIDLNEDGVIDDKDQAPIGYSGIPRVSYGLALNVAYKSFDFTVFVQGVGKYSGYYRAQGVHEHIIRGTYFDYHKRAWTAERYEHGEKITYPAISTRTTTNHVPNDFFIMDRSFTRLKNIELGYTLPAGILKTLGIQNLRVYISGQNLFTWDHLRMGHLDPENNDPIGYPMTRMQNFGLDITF